MFTAIVKKNTTGFNSNERVVVIPKGTRVELITPLKDRWTLCRVIDSKRELEISNDVLTLD